MLQTKKKILMTSSIGMALVLVLTLALAIIPKAFAAVEHLGYKAGTLYVSEEAQNVVVSLIASDNIDVFAVGGDFAKNETSSETDKYLTLMEMKYSDKFDGLGADTFVNEIGETAGRFMWMSDGEESTKLEFEANEVIWSGIYTVAAGAPVGTYDVALSDVSLLLTGEEDGKSGDIVAKVEIKGKTAQEINYADTTVSKYYGDAAFTNELTETTVDADGTIAYTSSDETVATVDTATGEVTIVGVGTTTITATAAETDDYKEATASYELTVSKKALTITSAEVVNKTYDGNADATVGIVTLSDGSLSQGSDYTATAVFDSANAGTRTATVTVALSEEKQAYYVLTETTFEITDATISQLTLAPSNIALEYDKTRYNGEEKKPSVEVKIGSFTVDSSEYAVTYAGNKEVGTATVTVTAEADTNIAGSAEATFEIVAKEVLSIYGVKDQSVVYTGSPVTLVGTLNVADNEAGITAADLTTTYYAADGTEIERPTNAGTYTVVYSYSDADCEGELKVNFEIAKAVSPNPVEVTADLKAEAGLSLADIAGTRTTGFAWADDTAVVLAGAHTYPASYTYDDDTTNYTTLGLSVSVYGLTRVTVSTSIDGDGGAIIAPATALENDTISVQFEPVEGYELKSVTLNGLDRTGAVVDDVLSITVGTSNLNIVASFRKVYTVTSGDGANIAIADDMTATFTIDADYALFTAGGSVYIDRALVDPEWYTVTSGSTVITISSAYLKAMSAGDHTLMVMFSDGGVARASFTLASASSDSSDSGVITPDTGAFTAKNGGANAAPGVIMTILALGIAGIIAKKKLAKNKVDFNK